MNRNVVFYFIIMIMCLLNLSNNECMPFKATVTCGLLIILYFNCELYIFFSAFLICTLLLNPIACSMYIITMKKANLSRVKFCLFAQTSLNKDAEYSE